LPQVARVAGIGSGTVLLDGSSARLSVVQPDRLSHLLRLSVTEGSLVGLHGNELAVSTSTAQKNHWLIGASVRVTYADGTASRFRIGALFQSDTTVGDYLMPAAAWTAHNAQATDSLILIKVQPGIGLTQAGAAIDRATRPYGAPSVETRQSYINAQGGYLTTLLDVAYGMLAFAITIALLGIGNTLSLSIYERTRELGLMRAVGASREQLRALVRWESLIVSLFGTLGGLAIGLFVGWGLALALARSGGEGVAGQVTVPILQVVLIVAVGAVAGLLAAIRPARRAARLDVLQAVAYE
jgi:putative ABC transport system permease protein